MARIFSAKFRRQLSLNYAAQNASTILNEPRHIAIMKEDWHQFDFDSILDQTLWVCDCDTTEIRNIRKHKKMTTFFFFLFLIHVCMFYSVSRGL